MQNNAAQQKQSRKSPSSLVGTEERMSQPSFSARLSHTSDEAFAELSISPRWFCRRIRPERALAHAVGLILITVLATSGSASAASKKEQPATPTAEAPSATRAFAPLAADRPLAAIWNDPEFTRRLLGSYGFASDVEPRMTPEEQAVYRDKVVPLLRDDPRKAIPVLEGLVKPSATAVFDFTLGNTYFQTEDLTNAVKHFQVAIGKFPDYRRAQKNLAFALARDGQYKQAIEPLTRTISLGGADSKVFGLLGFAYANQGRYVSAQAAYGQAVALEPENAEFKLGLVKCAVSTASYDQALSLLEELLQQNPEREAFWTLQANIFIQKEQPAKAATSLEILRRLGKATSQNLYLLGDLYMAQEARDLALSSYREAIDKDGGQNIGRALRPAQILVSRGAWDEARELFAQIRASSSQLDPADELKLLKLESKVAMAQGQGEKAIATLESVALKNPLDAEALLLAGDYYAKSGQPEKAEFRYKTAAGIQGFEADAYVKHAQLLVQSQKYAQAADLLRKAQKAKPRDNVQRYLDKIEQLARTSHS